MKIIETHIAGLVEIQPQVFGDQRGYFFESFRQDLLDEVTGGLSFVQDNESYSTAGVLRGLHFQTGEHAQGKLVRVIQGKVLDVAVDLRPHSSTFGAWCSVILDAEKHNLFYVPPGFAHGFYTLKEAIFSYKCTAYYHKESEGGILWNDTDLGIDWQLKGHPLVSQKDTVLPTFQDFKRNR